MRHSPSNVDLPDERKKGTFPLNVDLPVGRKGVLSSIHVDLPVCRQERCVFHKGRFFSWCGNFLLR